jgi:acyl carrier protein
LATVLDRVRYILVDHLGVDRTQVQSTTTFEELEIDSLDFIEIVIRLEDEFGGDGTGGGFEITDDHARDIKTVGDAVAYLKSRGIQDGVAG